MFLVVICGIVLVLVLGVLLLKKWPSRCVGREITHVKRGAMKPSPHIAECNEESCSADVDESDEYSEGELGVLKKNTSGGMGVVRRRHGHRGAVRTDIKRGENDSGAGHLRLSRLQKKKQEKEREREERQRALEALQEGRRVRQEEEREEQESREREEKERKELEEKALQELREEKKRREDEEYAKWVGAIGVEERGELGEEEQRRHDALIEYLKERARKIETRRQMLNRHTASGDHSENKPDVDGTASDDVKNILILAEVARKHDVTVDIAVKLIESLLKDGTISGVFDERGKFVLVAEEHYLKVAEFIQLRGRVSMKELVRECNRVIMS
uniref:DDRGK domain-containing protein 1 n=1 Tax=Trypanosoma vivax (strain Y486) TaxID=1055687 RepID=G0U5X7_TRYVY|nr:conserved hypothetical protein [Trypanosoma vivax Y486]